MAKKLKTKADDMRKLSDEELAEELEEAHRRLFALRLQNETRHITNHRELPQARRLIARVKTILRERELAAAGEGR